MHKSFIFSTHHRRVAALGFALLALASGAAQALTVGGSASAVTIEDTDGRKITIPGGGKSALLFYEDKDAGTQNQRTRDVVGPITDMPENRPRLVFLAVADVTKWNWQPARAFALKEISKIAKKEATTIYCDWRGDMLKLWKLTRGKSTVILVDAQGQVRFFAEGTLTPAQTEDLVRQMAALGIKTS